MIKTKKFLKKNKNHSRKKYKKSKKQKYKIYKKSRKIKLNKTKRKKKYTKKKYKQKGGNILGSVWDNALNIAQDWSDLSQLTNLSGMVEKRFIAQELEKQGAKQGTEAEVEGEADAAGESTACTWEGTAMEPAQATKYRATLARLDFPSIDRPDIQFCCKECSRKMASPVNGNWEMVKGVARYFLGRQRVAHFYEWQEAPTHMDIYADSNWAGCTKTRKNTTGVCHVHGSHLIRSLCRTQSKIALSSAEAELYAMTSGASEWLGAKAMGSDFGVGMGVYLHVDARAAIGVARGKGVGSNSTSRNHISADTGCRSREACQFA